MQSRSGQNGARIVQECTYVLVDYDWVFGLLGQVSILQAAECIPKRRELRSGGKQAHVPVCTSIPILVA